MAEESAGADAGAPSADGSGDAPAGTGAPSADATPRDGPGAEAVAVPPTSPSPSLTRRGRLGARLVPALIAALAAAIPFIVMCSDRHFRFSVPLGFVALTIATAGILQALGTFVGEDNRVAASTSLRALIPRLGEVLVSVVVHLGVLTLAVAGVLPKPIATAAVLVPTTFLGVVVATYRLGHAVGTFRDEDGSDRTLLQRHGFWLVALNVALYMPLLGSYSLSDPWETHYGEVAREMLARDDWISTWWAQDGWFWSKPVLDFWIQALSFSLLGVKYMPGEMLRAAERGLFPQPEWAARMPVFLLTLAGAYALYRSVARVYGRRTGFLAGLVLTTMPYWYLIAHQTMTDMPYVGPLAGTMALVLLGFVTDPERQVRLYEIRVGKSVFRISALHVLWATVILSTLPQLLYLASRNLTLHLRPDLMGFQFHPDEFFSGSGGGNCGLPGNQACTPEHPLNREIFLLRLGRFEIPLGIPIHLAVAWALALGVFLWTTRRESRLSRVYFLGAWYFLSLSMLGKGAPGLVLPIVSALGFVGVTQRWQDLRRVEILGLVLIVACVGLPWYVQMFMRHGPPFIDRLIMHDMYKRAFVHVHDTNQGDDTSFRYYVWQLGYGLFPWTGLAAGGLLWWLRRPDRTRDREGDAAALMVVWFIAAFGMFTITLTKFHHYILPLVPPTAVLTAVLVERLLGKGTLAKDGKFATYVVGTTAGVTLVVFGIARLFPRKFLGDALTGPAPWKGWGVLCIILGTALAIGTVKRLGVGRAATSPAESSGATRYDDAMLGLCGLASAVVIGLCGRDLFLTSAVGGVEGQARLMQLFTYNYGRSWPDSLNFKGALVAFTVVGAVLSLGIAVASFRRHSAALFCVAAAVWTAWGLDVYLYKCAPHWGQRETVLAYYKDRTNPNQPFVAYQMNWKGENFYLGNQVPAFVSSGEKFKSWVDEQKSHGIRRVYFTSEHGRSGSLKRELGDPPRYLELTDKTLNNKFFLARVEF
jgi:4-amino-4-deoxy-L-arabinose transferase-like glycosyltransferase